MNQKKVLVGVNASFDSLASVLLLKLQNFDVNAIHVLIDQSEYSDNLVNKDATHCLAKDDKKILEAIFSELSIPLYFVDMKENFQEMVVSNAVLANFMKEFHAPCLHCNKIKVLALFEKLGKLQANYIATGHYAKLRKSGQEGLVSLYQHNDSLVDQHKLLANIDQTILSKLLLPLSDLSREKVVSIVKEHLPKYADKLSLGQNHGFCSVLKDTSYAIKKQIPPSMNRKSRLFLRDNKTFLHEAYDNTEFDFGKVFKLGTSSKGKDQLLTVTGFNYSYQTIYVNQQPVSGINYIFVQLVEFFGKPNFYGPTIASISINDDSKILEAEIFFKGLNYAIIALKNDEYQFVPNKSFVYIFEDTRQGKRLAYLSKVVHQGKLENKSQNASFELAKLEGDFPF
jgi:tRNA U34 2-thiouridine synthase MnmA/TrmU